MQGLFLFIQSTKGIIVEDKVFMHVFSASGSFTNSISKFVSLNNNQFIVQIEDWIKNRSDRQLLEFIDFLPNESKEFILKAKGKQDINCFVNGGSFCEGDETYQGFVVELYDKKPDKMEAGIPYAININNKSNKYIWILSKSNNN